MRTAFMPCLLALAGFAPGCGSSTPPATSPSEATPAETAAAAHPCGEGDEPLAQAGHPVPDQIQQRAGDGTPGVALFGQRALKPPNDLGEAVGQGEGGGKVHEQT